MSRTHIERRIDAPLADVFRVVANAERFKDAIPAVLSVEFLSETRRGVGARFRETRQVGSRTSAIEMEVTEFAENDRVRLVSNSMGAEWNSVFRVEKNGIGTLLTLDMVARPKNVLGSIVVPVMRGMMQSALESDMDAVKAYCEAESQATAGQVGAAER